MTTVKNFKVKVVLHHLLGIPCTHLNSWAKLVFKYFNLHQVICWGFQIIIIVIETA